MRPSKAKIWDVCKTYFLITLGAAVYAVAFAWFYQPNHIGFGGLTGIAQIIHSLVPALPIGAMVAVGNIPLFLLGWKLLGGRTLVESLYAMLCTSLFIDLLSAFCPVPALEPMLACIFGGVVLGVGLGLVFLQKATTGGTDLMARLLKLKIGWLPMGKILLYIDLTVILSVALAFRSMESGLYGLIGLYISSLVMDKMLYGLDTAKVAYIISSKPEEVIAGITEQLQRGVTLLEGRGGWSGQEREVLLCAFKQRQIVELKALVKGIDPDAFLIVCNAQEVLGDGFGVYRKDDI